MTLHFIDRLPVLGYREVDGRDLAFAWAWHTPCLRVTFTEEEPALLGRIIHLDHCPRLVPAADNLDWVQAADDRRLRILGHAADLWHRKEHFFRTFDKLEPAASRNRRRAAEAHLDIRPIEPVHRSPYGSRMDSASPELHISVKGLPPAKSEAFSLFNPQHEHRDRLIALRRAARDSMKETGFTPFGRLDRLGLEVTVACPIDQAWDATNYLGGIADALQPPSSGAHELDHLEDLANVMVYPNDRMIHRIHYEFVDTSPPAYEVRIWRL